MLHYKYIKNAYIKKRERIEIRKKNWRRAHYKLHYYFLYKHKKKFIHISINKYLIVIYCYHFFFIFSKTIVGVILWKLSFVLYTAILNAKRNERIKRIFLY